MKLLGTLLFNVFSGFALWLAKFLTQKIAVAIAIIAILTVLFVGLYAMLRVAISASLVAAGNIHPMFGAGISIFVPPHSAALVTSYITLWSAVELYKWKVSILQIWSKTI